MIFDTIRLSGLINVDLQKQNVDPSSPYYLKDITGLGPPDIDVTITQSTKGGGLFQSSRPQGREVVVRVGLNPDYSTGQTVSDLRIALYGLMKAEGQGPSVIKLMNAGTAVMRADCYVKRFEMAVISKDPEVQITFACVSPYFEAPDDIILDGFSGLALDPTINNPGNAPTGMRLIVGLTADVTSLHISSVSNPGYHMFIDASIDDVNEVIIDSRPGQRTVEAVDDHDAVTNLIDSISGDSDWLMLNEGDNDFTIAPHTFHWIQVLYTPQYWGI